MRRVPQDTGEERLIGEAEVLAGLRAAGAAVVRSRAARARAGLRPAARARARRRRSSARSSGRRSSGGSAPTTSCSPPSPADGRYDRRAWASSSARTPRPRSPIHRPVQASAGRSRAEIARLTAANRAAPDPDAERRLLRLRHQPASSGSTRASAAGYRRARRGGAPVGRRAARDRRGDLTPGLLRAGDPARRLRARARSGRPRRRPRARRADRSRLRGARRGRRGRLVAGLYEEFEPEAPFEVTTVRPWIKQGGGVLAADSPRARRSRCSSCSRQPGCRSSSPATSASAALLSVHKTTLRKAEPTVGGAWHQDGAFMGDVTRAEPLAVALALRRRGARARHRPAPRRPVVIEHDAMLDVELTRARGARGGRRRADPAPDLRARRRAVLRRAVPAPDRRRIPRCRSRASRSRAGSSAARRSRPTTRRSRSDRSATTSTSRFDARVACGSRPRASRVAARRARSRQRVAVDHHEEQRVAPRRGRGPPSTCRGGGASRDDPERVVAHLVARRRRRSGARRRSATVERRGHADRGESGPRRRRRRPAGDSRSIAPRRRRSRAAGSAVRASSRRRPRRPPTASAGGGDPSRGPAARMSAARHSAIAGHDDAPGCASRAGSIRPRSTSASPTGAAAASASTSTSPALEPRRRPRPRRRAGRPRRARAPARARPAPGTPGRSRSRVAGRGVGVADHPVCERRAHVARR